MSDQTVETIGAASTVRETLRQFQKTAPRPRPIPPASMSPMLATLTDQPFDDPHWIFEPKLDGVRCLAIRKKSGVRLFSRNNLSFNSYYPELIEALGRQEADDFVIDGEIVAFKPGTTISSFSQLQQRMHVLNGGPPAPNRVRIYFFAFDLLELMGRDVRSVPLLKRKDLLKKIIAYNDIVRFTTHLIGSGISYFKESCGLGWEGLIAKRADSLYTAGRSRDWLKLKCVNEQEMVIGGYTEPQGGRSGFGALLLGYYENGRLRFSGKVGTGFDEKLLRTLTQRLKALEQKTSPFGEIDLPRKGLHWVKPELVAQIGFGEWTDDGKLRHPRFLGLRNDMPAEGVIREVKRPLPDIAPAEREASMTSRNVTISHPNKVMYPETGFTKKDMLEYYRQVAPTLLPYLEKRPITMKRYPDGVAGPYFYEKQAPSYRPSWLKTFRMTDETNHNPVDYALINDVDSLLWIANLASIEMHVLLAQAPAVECPTAMVFDLDPGPPASLLDCLRIAIHLRDLLETFGLKSFPKVSGGKGLHLYVPLNTPISYKETQPFAHATAMLLEKQNRRVVSNMRKQLRQGKVLVDWSQNSRHKTTVAAYSLRTQSHPTVSTPITWDELVSALKRRNIATLQFSPKDVLARIQKHGDLFQDVLTLKQTLPPLKNSSV